MMKKFLIIIAVSLPLCVDSALGQTVQPTPPAGQGLYDAAGVIVGRIVAPGIVMRSINNRWIGFAVGADGLAEETPIANTSTAVLFPTSNCSGTAYLSFVPQFTQYRPGGWGAPVIGALLGATLVSKNIFNTYPYYYKSGTLYYAGTPARMVIKSMALIVSTPFVRGACQTIPTSSQGAFLVGPVTTTTLGPFTPPFVVK